MNSIISQVRTETANGKAPGADPFDDSLAIERLLPETPSSEGPSVGQCFGDYELLSVIARGGMGVVYRARRLSTEAVVALKMIRDDRVVAANEIRRFHRESVAAGSLSHPHIVPVLDAGECGGHQYFTMLLAGGGSLAANHKRHRESPRAAAELIEKVARAVHHAHLHGVLHRDLKPSNILLDDAGEPMVCDFGLAKFAGEQSAVSQSVIAGTPPYMAPEQVRWPCDRIGPHTDVWALGVILYELLTGELPFRGETQTELTYQIVFAAPRPPAALRADLPRQLSAIVLNCLEKRPTLRYSSAEELANDLNNWLRGSGPVQAIDRTLLDSVSRFAKRRPFMSVTLLSGLLALPVGYAAFSSRPNESVALAQAQNTLSSGKVLTLIGNTGGVPKWSNWVAHSTGGSLDAVPDGTCLAQCWDFGLLELLPAAPSSGYRFSAEVRHVAAGRPGLVGLYFGRNRYETDRGAFQSFCTLLFNDRDDREPAKPTDKSVNEVRLDLRVKRDDDRSDNPIATFSSGVGRLFAIRMADESREDGWRRLAVEVTDGQVRAYWEGEFIGDWTIDKIRRTYSGVPHDFPLDAMPLFDGGLGICIHQGAVTVRNIRVEPISE